METTINIGGSFERGWGLFRDNMSYLASSFVILFLCSAILSAVDFLALLQIVWSPPLWGGMVFAVRAVANKEEANFEKLIDGFRLTFLPFFISTLVMVVAFIFFFILIGAAMYGALVLMGIGVSSSGLEGASGFGAALLVLIFFLIAIAIYSRFLFIDFYIVEKKLGGWEAVQASWEMTGRNWPMTVVFSFAISFVLASGLLAFIIGIFFTAPLVFCIRNAAFEQMEGIIGARQTGAASSASGLATAPPPIPGAVPQAPPPLGAEGGEYKSGEYVHLFVFGEGGDMNDDRAWAIAEESSPTMLQKPNDPVVSGASVPQWPESRVEFFRIVESEIDRYISRVPTAPDYLDKSRFKLRMKTGRDKAGNKRIALVSVVAL